MANASLPGEPPTGRGKGRRFVWEEELAHEGCVVLRAWGAARIVTVEPNHGTHQLEGLAWLMSIDRYTAQGVRPSV